MENKIVRREAQGKQPKKVIAIGKRVKGRWQVKTSLWRYLASTALSAQ